MVETPVDDATERTQVEEEVIELGFPANCVEPLSAIYILRVDRDGWHLTHEAGMFWITMKMYDTENPKAFILAARSFIVNHGLNAGNPSVEDYLRKFWQFLTLAPAALWQPLEALASRLRDHYDGQVSFVAVLVFFALELRQELYWELFRF